MLTARVIDKGDHQEIILPKQIRIDASRAIIKQLDDVIMLIPDRKGRGRYRNLTDSLRHFSEDFMAERNQPTELDKREEF